jgi:hypothetical protein
MNDDACDAAARRCVSYSAVSISTNDQRIDAGGSGDVARGDAPRRVEEACRSLP